MYIKQTAEMLGVELNEYFEVYDEANTLKGQYCFDEIGFPDSHILLNILNGTYTMKKKKFKPKNGQEYFFFAPDGNFSGGINKKEWNDSLIDLEHYYTGNIYRSKEESKRYKDELMNKLREEYTGEERD